MASSKTVVKGLRAEQEFFDKCDMVAKLEGVDRNKLIVMAVNEHIDRYQWFSCTTLNGGTTYICGKEEENE